MNQAVTPVARVRMICALSISLLAASFSGYALSANENDLQQLLTIQSQVQRVVQQQMGIVVAVTDGIGYGSGVIVSEDGLVLTAGHVMETGGKNYRVIFPDGREAKAKPLGKNLNVDAGMVKITEPGPWPFAELGDPTQLGRGDWCVCLGHSGGYEIGRTPPVRAGRIVKFEPDQIVTDCALIGGDSGGPLFDLSGRVIGIHSSIGSSVAENRHVSIATFAEHWERMVSGQVWGVLPELANRETNQASMGVRVDREAERAKILLVHPGGAAETAGVKPGDIVSRFDDVPISDSNHLIDLIAQRRPGESVALEVIRGTEKIQLQLRLGKK